MRLAAWGTPQKFWPNGDPMDENASVSLGDVFQNNQLPQNPAQIDASSKGNTFQAAKNALEEMRQAQVNPKAGENLNFQAEGTERGTSNRTEALWADRDKMNELLDQIMNHPEMQRLRQGNDLERQLIQVGLGQTPQLDLSPLAALTDAQTGSHFAQSYTPPETGAKGRAQMLAFTDKAQDNERDLWKGAMEAVKGFKSGTDTQTLYNQLLLKAGAKVGGTNPLSNTEYRMDRVAHNNVIRQLNTNPLVVKTVGSLNQIKSGLNLLTTAKNINPNLLKEAQVIIRTAIQNGSGSRTGVDERAQTYVNDLGMDWGVVKQYLTSDISKMRPDDPIVQHFVGLAKNTSQTLSDQIQNNIGYLAGGYASVYDRNPDLYDDLLKKIDLGYKSFSPAQSHLKTAPAHSQAPAAPKTGLPSLDAIDAELKKRGGK